MIMPYTNIGISDLPNILGKIFGFPNAGNSGGSTPSVSIPSGSSSSSSDTKVLPPLPEALTPESSTSKPPTSEPSTPYDYSILEYLEGLFSSVGAENEVNRLYNSAEARLNREFQAQESQIQRDWYEYMSNSAYQRSMADMKAAGLNPILAYSQGGAASSGTGIPSGSSASYQGSGGDSLSSILSSFADVISALTGASASKIDKAFKLFKMFGG